jgi:hypothetical protein
MQPIKKSIINQVITIFNVIKEGEDDETSYYRTILQNVRVMEPKKTLFLSTVGLKSTYDMSILIDYKNTQGLTEEKGEKKEFLLQNDWINLAVTEKPKYWTLQPLDWVFFTVGKINSICPGFNTENDQEQKFKQKYLIRAISSINTILNKDSSIHHFEVFCD